MPYPYWTSNTSVSPAISIVLLMSTGVHNDAISEKKNHFQTAEKRSIAPVTDLFPMLPPIELKEVLLAEIRFPLPETLLLLRVAGVLIDPLITSFFHFNSFLGEI